MKKFLKLISMFIVFFVILTINKLSVYALSGNIDLTTDKTIVDVNEKITVKVKISEDGNSLGSWQYRLSHSNNLSLISGDENIVDVVNDNLTNEKEYELIYKAISSGTANINIDDVKIIDYDTEESINIQKSNNINISINSSSANVKNGIYKEGNDTYYYVNDIKQTGFQEIEGKTYYFSVSSKKMLYGLTYINTDYYYFDENGVMYQNNILELEGNKYYFNKEGKRSTGFQEIEGKIYYFSVFDGKMLYGFRTIGNDKYYLSDEGIVQTGFQEIEGKTYYFSVYGGRMLKGLIFINSDHYYFDKNGVLQIGFQKIEGKTYYFSVYGGRMLKGLIFINSDHYYFDENGVMQTGFQEIEGKTYYFSVFGGERLYGLKLIGNHLYYFDENGVMQRNFSITIDGKTYTFGSDGASTEGFQTINGKQYYMFSDGSFAKGVVKILNTRYYFDFITGELLKSNVKSIIDVSYSQGRIDWDTLWVSGQIDGAIIRIGYGTSKTDDPVLDSYFAYNIAAIKRLNIPYSIYIFGYAQTPYAAEKEASFVANTLNNYGATNLSMPIFYDAEISYWNGLDYTSSVYSNTITSFSNKLKSLGFNNVGVYGSYSWFTNDGGRLNSDVIRSNPLWVAQYYNKCSYTGPLVGWQYSNEGLLPGISTRVDMNIFF